MSPLQGGRQSTKCDAGGFLDVDELREDGACLG